MEDLETIKAQAEYARMLYRNRKITRGEAVGKIQPYLDMVNNKSKELAKERGEIPKLVSFNNYVR